MENHDDLMSILGLGESAKPETPEQKFMIFLTFGPSPRIMMLENFLLHEMAHFHYLKSNNVNFQLHNRPLLCIDYARLMVKYYLCMCYLGRFDKSIGLDIKMCDLDVTVENIVALENVQKIILKKRD